MPGLDIQGGRMIQDDHLPSAMTGSQQRPLARVILQKEELTALYRFTAARQDQLQPGFIVPAPFP